MEREMMEAAEMDFLSLEIDFDYEFDASRYFDFVREETASQEWEAQHWFDMAGSYPPSPFMSKMASGEVLFAESINTMPKVKNSDISRDNSNKVVHQDSHILEESFGVLNCFKDDPCKNDKGFVFASSTRCSTLMKPTASHLAKQNYPHGEVRYSQQSVHRLWKPFADKGMQKQDPSENVVHAAKRQKLDGGNLCKVVSVNQLTDLLHKRPQMNNLTTSSKLRLTIPREPQLETERRARKIRVQRSDSVQLSLEKTPVSSTIKAYPFNKKILDSSSMPLCQKSTRRSPECQSSMSKLSERTPDYSVAAASSLDTINVMAGATCSQDDSLHATCFKHQPYTTSIFHFDNQERHNGDRNLSKFKARPLDRKILLSKGDVGVFRSAKRETTKTMEFNLSKNKRSQQDVPIELFNKLSLKSDGHQSSTRHENPILPLRRFLKESKENLADTVQHGQKSRDHANQANTLKQRTKQFGSENRTSSYPRLEAGYMRKKAIH